MGPQWPWAGGDEVVGLIPAYACCYWELSVAGLYCFGERVVVRAGAGRVENCAGTPTDARSFFLSIGVKSSTWTLKVQRL